MGKKLIINGANFGKNGLREQYVAMETLTEQGYVIQTSSGGYRTLAKTDTAYYKNYVKNKESIVLYPGDTIVFSENDYMVQYTIYCYPSVNGTNYPSYEAGTTTKYVSSVSPSLRATYNGATDTLPTSVKNTTEDVLYVVLQGRGSLSSGSLLSPSTLPSLAYRIYTDSPENYESEITN